ncbi:MAG: sigma 54-interacting transcriptional regulator [Thermoanaerobaculia bacterium]|nr:sigma 54-interacting transcriptional regulator [Thermoanaerobaculia bacterium]
MARRIRELSVRAWGPGRAVEIVGESEPVHLLLRQIEKVAAFDEPVLILGESGSGKEALSQAVFLLGDRKPFVSVNCPQYQDGNLTVSELFGHRRGSFTGAVRDRKGLFETANDGLIFLDEIGDLPMSAQLMLLRALSSGEFKALGSEEIQRSNVRVIAATNRSMNQLAEDKEFRRDLLFRLRYFLIKVPPLRERGDDWILLLNHVLEGLHQRYGVRKRMSNAAMDLLAGYSWPGNVRELIGITTSGYAMAEGDTIEPLNFVDALEEESGVSSENRLDVLSRRLVQQKDSFWDLVHRPFIDRELNRGEVRQLVARGLREGGGSYRGLLKRWRMSEEHYQKLMDFLRHHSLKPRSSRGE